MKRGSLTAIFLLVLGLAYSMEIPRTVENIPSALLAEKVQSDEDFLLDRQIHERLEQFIKSCVQKKYAERLERFSENEWDAAGWYLFMLDQIVNEGENCEYLKWYDKPLQVSAIAVLELEIEIFLAEHE
jgi:hypothetical protein